MSKKPTVLMILDGYGMSDKVEGNAIAQAKTPVMDKLMAECPFVLGQASGMAVGLPEGQMGNSEVGHTNMGAGRIVYQMLVKISKSIQDGDFFENEALKKAVENCKKNDSALHLMGLLSPGGVHSHMEHLYGLLELAKKNGIDKVYVHAYLDGYSGFPDHRHPCKPKSPLLSYSDSLLRRCHPFHSDGSRSAPGNSDSACRRCVR